MGQGYMKICTLNLRLPIFFPECFHTGLYSLGSKFENTSPVTPIGLREKDLKILTWKVLQRYGPGRPLPSSSWAALVPWHVGSHDLGFNPHQGQVGK